MGGVSPGLLALQVLHRNHRAGEHPTLVQVGQSWGGTGDVREHRGTESIRGRGGVGGIGGWEGLRV